MLCLCYLKGTFDILGALKKLRILDVSDNQLTSLPDELASLPLLTQIVVNNNNLRELPPCVLQMEQIEVSFPIKLFYRKYFS